MAIGVFDSGVGGLTVVSALRQASAETDIVYLGDSARVPYGSKSPETVQKYSLACQRFLLDQGVEAIMVACNTASAYAIDVLRKNCTVPVTGAVVPGAQSAAAVTSTKTIAVIGTRGTVSSGAYNHALASILPEATVVSAPCPLFVPLAEEGWLQGEVTRAVIDHYLAPLFDQEPQIDVLVLGCTHYPLLKDELRSWLDSHNLERVQLIDSAQAMANSAIAENIGLRGSGSLKLFVTDESAMDTLVERFLGRSAPATKVDLTVA